MHPSRVRILRASFSMILAFLQGITRGVLLAAMGCNLLTMFGNVW